MRHLSRIRGTSKATVAAAALLAAGLTAGCGGSPARLAAASQRSHPVRPAQGGAPWAGRARATPAAPAAPAAKSSRAGTPAQPAAPGTPASPASPAAPAPGSPPPAAPSCPTSGLRVSAGQANGAAGSIYYPLEFTNTSALACTLYGYPGVSFVTGTGGRQLGGAAVRNATFPARLVTLGPGATAHASLQVVIAQNYPTATCKPVTAHWLRIYPPGQYVPLYLGFTAQTCTGSVPGGSTLGIYVVRTGSSGP